MKNKEAKLIYLDVCALCRPFDNQSYLRIRIETEAVNLIISKVKEDIYKMIISPAHLIEINAISEIIERNHILNLIERYGIQFKFNLKQVKVRAEELANLKFGIADAAHLAFAEIAQAYFISCDDKLIKKCKKHKVKIWCGNPIDFCIKEDLK